MEKKTITKEEITQLNDLRTKESIMIQNLGIIQGQMISLKKAQESVEVEFWKLKEEQTSFAQSLQDKYGDGNINTETGEFESLN